MSTIKNQRCFTEATASARLILATGLKSRGYKKEISSTIIFFCYPEKEVMSALFNFVFTARNRF